jgi:pimeloyl-ACP methyl ester carboxylesterase
VTRLVLIHGLAGSARSWQRLTPLLGDRPVTAVDLPGHGSNAGSSGAATIGGMADAVRLDEPTVLVGHSMGGLVATELATRASEWVERLVLVNSPPTVASRLTAHKGGERAVAMPVLGPVLWRVMTDAQRRAGAASAVAPGFDPPDVFVEDARRLSWSAFARATRATDAYLAEQTLHARVAALSVPVTVVFGERDRRVALDSLDGYEGVSVVRIPDAGHSPMWETPERLAEVIGSAPSS